MYFDEKEKRFIAIVESNLKHFNKGRRKQLTVSYHVSGGNKADVQFNGKTIAAGLTMEQLHYFIFGFISGRDKK